jgi:hypothetical protein
MKKKNCVVVVVVLCLWGGLVGITSAEPIATLTDGNSTVRFDLGSAGVGMNEWTVDGINRLVEQSFWYRVGDTPQQRVNALTLSSWAVSGDYLLNATYSDPANRFTIQLRFVLTGCDPGSGVSDINETVKVKNLSAAALDFHLYEYVDIDLLGLAQPIDSSLQLTGTPVNTATQENGAVSLAESVATPNASHSEAGNAALLLSKLKSGSVYNLNDTLSASSDDFAWAFQWDVAIDPSQTLLISKDKRLQLIPEPSTVVLLGIGALGLLAYAWRRRQD